jgi:hypothetical protein
MRPASPIPRRRRWFLDDVIMPHRLGSASPALNMLRHEAAILEKR